MACGTLSQVPQAECFTGQVADAYHDHANEPLLCRTLHLRQTGVAAYPDQTQPLCAEVETLSFSFSIVTGFATATLGSSLSVCVTSVTNSNYGSSDRQ
jgi:hypothetical protein